MPNVDDLINGKVSITEKLTGVLRLVNEVFADPALVTTNTDEDLGDIARRIVEADIMNYGLFRTPQIEQIHLFEMGGEDIIDVLQSQWGQTRSFGKHHILELPAADPGRKFVHKVGIFGEMFGGIFTYVVPAGGQLEVEERLPIEEKDSTAPNPDSEIVYRRITTFLRWDGDERP
ncbi:uncharacterized protein METZ01_LOCUS494586, partial [marine metagenome]